jgi:hypothetical protein
MKRYLRRVRRWAHHNRRNLVVALGTFSLTVLVLMALSMASGVRFEPSGSHGGSDGLGGIDSLGNEVTAEERDYFTRASPQEQTQILRDQQEKALTRGSE